MPEEVAIIGAGPAGLATAIQLKRNGIDALVFEREKMGGLLWNANLVENYPGFPGGIPGPELTRRFMQQAQDLNIEVTFQEVNDISFEQGVFQLTTDRDHHAANTLVIASGTRPLPITGVTIPKDLTGRIYYEVRDLLKVRDRDIIIVGSGDAAFDYALNLGRNNRVIILNRSTEAKCLHLLRERAEKEANITYKNKTAIQCLENDARGGMLVDCQAPEGALQFHADYLIGAIGREPDLSCCSIDFRRQVQDLEKAGVLYMIGDVKNGIYRQTSIAVGDGVMAAMKICRCLKESA